MKYQVMPDMAQEEYDALKADITDRGVMIPIEFDENGNILDGHHRLKICEELGITDYPKIIRSGMDEMEKRTHARKLNIIRRHLSRDQRRELIREQIKDSPELSDRQIAKLLCVSNSTVSLARWELVDNGQLCDSHTSIGPDGKTYKRHSIIDMLLRRAAKLNDILKLAEGKEFIDDDYIYELENFAVFNQTMKDKIKEHIQSTPDINETIAMINVLTPFVSDLSISALYAERYMGQIIADAKEGGYWDKMQHYANMPHEKQKFIENEVDRLLSIPEEKIREMDFEKLAAYNSNVERILVEFQNKRFS